MENIDLLRVYGVGLLNRRETKEISQNEIAQMNESLAEIVATISLSMDNTYVEDIDAQTELILVVFTIVLSHSIRFLSTNSF